MADCGLLLLVLYTLNFKDFLHGSKHIIGDDVRLTEMRLKGQIAVTVIDID